MHRYKAEGHEELPKRKQSALLKTQKLQNTQHPNTQSVFYYRHEYFFILLIDFYFCHTQSVIKLARMDNYLRKYRIFDIPSWRYTPFIFIE